MKREGRARYCAHCEADVHDGATYCPFCGTDLLVDSFEGASSRERVGGGEDPTSSPPPTNPPHPFLSSHPLREENPLSPSEPSFTLVEPSVSSRTSLYSGGRSAPNQSREEGNIRKEEKKKRDDKGGMLALVLLSLGSLFLMLGLLLLFFSRDGYVELSWKSKYWFVYCLFGLPLAIWGGRKLRVPSET